MADLSNPKKAFVPTLRVTAIKLRKIHLKTMFFLSFMKVRLSP